MSSIECFVPSMNGEDISTTVESFSRSHSFTGVTILSGVSLRSTQTLKSIAEAVSQKYILIYTKDLPLEMGLFALDRFIAIAEDTKADMLYADHYEVLSEMTLTLEVCLFSEVPHSARPFVLWRKTMSGEPYMTSV